jgi:hypothetical protein
LSNFLRTKKGKKKQHAKPKEFLVFALKNQKCQKMKPSQDSQQVAKKKRIITKDLASFVQKMKRIKDEKQ